ncbi:hypothetical protein AJ79_06150 [Helicocarpus griseus UAMH5409]|uniref:EGF domain-specific O-linked N-acetylglucosamine transferase n=1 Tax=Helicocarpus griseus UAMH5409 TaxID=1447875 RepID=A0A2B7XGC8_9EURO|nr:hypothetical protein AJ79_06150 [Helicocarpus griseus UAMH5409]
MYAAPPFRLQRHIIPGTLIVFVVFLFYLELSPPSSTVHPSPSGNTQKDDYLVEPFFEPHAEGASTKHANTLPKTSPVANDNYRIQIQSSAPGDGITSPEEPPLPVDSHKGPIEDPSTIHVDVAVPTTLPLPDDYQPPSAQEDTFCSDRFSHHFLQNLVTNQTSYCDDGSASDLTCFHGPINKYGRRDSFCISGPATFNNDSKKFAFDCDLRRLNKAEIAQRIPRFQRFPEYWYETGPHYIFEHFVHLGREEKPSLRVENGRRNFSILLKREGSANLFHCLMEIFSLALTMDVLRMAANPATKLPFFSSEDFSNTQIVVLDDLPDGPYFDLWSMFAKQPAVRLKDISATHQVNLDNVIVPMPGAANPFWLSQWEPLPCEHAELLQTFVKRVLNFYGIRDDRRTADTPLVLTFINRTEKRRLIGQERYIARLKAKFPEVEIKSVDFAAIPFKEQLRLVRRTDILVGVTGAGMTHGLFLPQDSTVAEIVPPDIKYRGFRNFAKQLGHKYFSSHGTKYATNRTEDDWASDDVFIEEDRFMDLMEVAVKSMYNRGLSNLDAS